jgi:hypothetical protein
MEERLDGGKAGGAVRVDDTVRRAAGPWTPAVHALLSHLARTGFPGSPRPLGIDAQGREILSFVPGETVGSALPWPGWAHADDTLVQVARWLHRYHEAVADFAPPGAIWRMGGQWRLAGTGDPLFTQIVAQGAVDDLDIALAALQEIR